MTAPTSGSKLRVLLDEHEMVRRGMRELLGGEGDIEVVGEAATAAEALASAPAARPQAAVLDVRLDIGKHDAAYGFPRTPQERPGQPGRAGERAR